jgi:hypothetical protein
MTVLLTGDDVISFVGIFHPARVHIIIYGERDDARSFGKPQVPLRFDLRDPVEYLTRVGRLFHCLASWNIGMGPRQHSLRVEICEGVPVVGVTSQLVRCIHGLRICRHAHFHIRRRWDCGRH